MPRWFSSFRRDGASGDPADATSVLELLVVEGVDAGQQFTVDGPEVHIGRGKPQTGQAGSVLLHDTTVSAEQATIRTDRRGTMLEHNPRATNPTFVNGHRLRRPRSLSPSDRIQMGRVVLEVRQRQGRGLSGFFAVTGTQPRVDDADLTGDGTEPLTVLEARSGDEDATRIREAPTDHEALTMVRTSSSHSGSLMIVRGFDEMTDVGFELGAVMTSIGRSAQSDITIPEPGISRQHCRLEWRGDDLVLVHLSATNATSVNGMPVTSECSLASGDEVLLADQVAVRIDFEVEAQSLDRTTVPIDVPKRSLHEQMEARIEQERLIEEEFSVEGSFLDIDVVGSYAMKAGAERPAHIIVSFERFRSFVERVINEFGGQVLNSNGDELMCFFESTDAAVRSGSAILSRLDDFNVKENVLSSPFRFRIGVHTGTSLVDRARGVAYSPVLDVAGHLQKHADVNGLLISEDTMRALPGDKPSAAAFESAGPLPEEGIGTYRLARPL